MRKTPPNFSLHRISNPEDIKQTLGFFFDVFPEELKNGYDHSECYSESISEGKGGEHTLTYYLVLNDSGNAVGTTGLYSGDGETAWLGWYGIRPEYRNRGYGRAVLLATLDLMRSLGFKFVRIYTDDVANADAVRIYRSLGFVRDGEFRDPDNGSLVSTYKRAIREDDPMPPDWVGRPHGY